ncbi:RluA family pseudouridine synthase [Ostreibacterium oceani]|uniref:Ribosomal large subunit pseudouridine synthase C n=1 Tax=Ostreibacterium oceani TaxID=2654998 RepID=A0A6N7EX42_9GAMM|nr:RluA family pseudouridine synthase [Ostreibacterium oceani]MPV86503.1 RluA family pseudouridine synthase [Ostreibacterium oceani]
MPTHRHHAPKTSASVKKRSNTKKSSKQPPTKNPARKRPAAVKAGGNPRAENQTRRNPKSTPKVAQKTTAKTTPKATQKTTSKTRTAKISTAKVTAPARAISPKTDEDTRQSFGVRHLVISASDDGQRVDNYLRKILPNVPKSRRYQMLRKGEVRLNKKRISADDRLTAGDVLRLPPTTIDEKAKHHIPRALIDKIQQSVLFNNGTYLVINKPAGFAVHAGTKTEFGVIDMVRAAYPDTPWELCHRLDKPTSGCLVFASNRDALRHFQMLSQSDGMTKSYLALVKGRWEVNHLIVDSPIEKIDTVDALETFTGDEKTAVSIFTTLETYKSTSLMQVVIKTGRTHQIRIHAARQEHPVAMDDKYGNFRWNRTLEKYGISRLFLHAHVIQFRSEDETIHVSAPLPEDLQRYIDQQR